MNSVSFCSTGLPEDGIYASDSDSEDDDILMPLDVDDKKDRWDCETILSESTINCGSTSQLYRDLLGTSVTSDVQ